MIIIILIFFCGCYNNKSHIDHKTNHIDNIKNITTISKNIKKQLLLPGIKEIIDRGYIKIAMIANDIDVFCRTANDDELLGLDVNMARNIADILGVDLMIDQTAKKYDDIITLLSENMVDLGIAMYSIDTARAACVNLSEPYLISNLCIMINKKELARNHIEKNPIDYMRENRVKVAVLKGSVHVRAVKKAFPEVRIIEMDSQEEIRQSVIDNDVFGCFSGQVESLCDYIQCPEVAIYTKSFVFIDESDKFCVAISPKNIDMLNFINAYISSSKILTIDDVEQACRDLYNY